MSQITIIGLGLIGTSIGLGLKALGRGYTLVGHDKNRKAMDQALKRGAVDRTHWNLIAACEQADMIIVAIPLNEIPATFKAIQQDLKTGCLIMDTAPLKRPALQAASDHLPTTVHFIGTNPILPRGDRMQTEDASAELFQGRLWALCPSEEADSDAVQVVTSMVQALGAQPYFLSPEEHDGLAAAAESLPTLLAGALMHAVSEHPSWREIRKMAGNQFERVTALPSFEAEALADMVFDNRDNVGLWLQEMIIELERWSRALQEEDASTLVKWFQEAQEKRNAWLTLLETGDWENALKRDQIEYAGFFSRMFGAGAFSRKRDKLWKD